MTDIYEQPEDREPVTMSPKSLVDAWGDERFSDIDDPGEEHWSGSEMIAADLGPAMNTVLTSGVANGDFAQGPPDASMPIGDENPLPHWRHTRVQGGGITLHWVTDVAAPAGKAIRATITGAVADDDVYLEQIIPVSPRQQLKIPTLRVKEGTDADSLAEIRLQYFKADGTTTGTESVGTLDTTFLDPQDVYAVAGIPQDARWARLRLVVAPAGAIASDTIYFYEAWAGQPLVSYETWAFSGVALPGTGAQALRAVSSNSAGTLNNLAEYYTTPDAGQGSIGWVVSIAVKLHTMRTAGTVTFQLRNEVDFTVVGPIATINATENLQAWASEQLVSASVLLAPGGRYQLLATGTGFTPTTASTFAHVKVAFVQLFTATGGSS